MESPNEENIIKDIRNILRLKKETEGTKDIVLRNIKNLFEYEKEEENYHKPVRLNNFWSNNYIQYKSVTVIKTEYYQLNNVMIKLEHI